MEVDQESVPGVSTLVTASINPESASSLEGLGMGLDHIVDPDLVFPDPDKCGPAGPADITMDTETLDPHKNPITSASENQAPPSPSGPDLIMPTKIQNSAGSPSAPPSPGPVIEEVIGAADKKLTDRDHELDSVTVVPETDTTDKGPQKQVPLDPLFSQVFQDLQSTQQRLELLAGYVRSKFVGDPTFPKEFLDPSHSPMSPSSSGYNIRSKSNKRSGSGKNKNKKRPLSPRPKSQQQNRNQRTKRSRVRADSGSEDVISLSSPAPGPSFDSFDFDDDPGQISNSEEQEPADTSALSLGGQDKLQESEEDEDFDIEITNLEILGENLSDSDGSHPCPNCPHLAESSLELKIHSMMTHVYVSIERLTQETLDQYHREPEPSPEVESMVSTFLTSDFFSLLNASPEITVQEGQGIVLLSPGGQQVPGPGRLLQMQNQQSQDPTRYVPSHQKYSCGHCSKDFRSYAQLQKHVISHKVRQPEPKPKPTRAKPPPPRPQVKYNCPKPNCAQYFSNPSQLAKHLDDHAKKECNICGKYFTRPYNLKLHLQTHAQQQQIRPRPGPTRVTMIPTGPKLPGPAPSARHIVLPIHKCTVCQRAFTQPTSLRIHMESHAAGSESGGPVHACHGCGKKFRFESTLKSHIDTCPQVIFGNGQAKNTNAMPNTTEDFPCSICDKSYTQAGSRNRHMREVHGWEISTGPRSPGAPGVPGDLEMDEDIGFE